MCSCHHQQVVQANKSVYTDTKIPSIQIFLPLFAPHLPTTLRTLQCRKIKVSNFSKKRNLIFGEKYHHLTFGLNMFFKKHFLRLLFYPIEFVSNYKVPSKMDSFTYTIKKDCWMERSIVHDMRILFDALQVRCLRKNSFCVTYNFLRTKRPGSPSRSHIVLSKLDLVIL